MNLSVRHITPILNVRSVPDSIAWFEKLGFTKCWDYGSPPTFGSVGAGAFEIFLCQNDQGGRDEHASWMTVWVDDLDGLHRRLSGAGLEIIKRPTLEPWGVLEMHVRHPDGHVLRLSQARPH